VTYLVADRAEDILPKLLDAASSLAETDATKGANIEKM
jgi:hypothetical protein